MEALVVELGLMVLLQRQVLAQLVKDLREELEMVLVRSKEDQVVVVLANWEILIKRRIQGAILVVAVLAEMVFSLP